MQHDYLIITGSNHTLEILHRSASADFYANYEKLASSKPVRFPKAPMMSSSDRITLDPDICHGKPCIRGLRYPVEHVLEMLAGGMSIEQILVDYADLEREDILAALSYAARLAQVKRMERLAA